MRNAWKFNSRRIWSQNWKYFRWLIRSSDGFSMPNQIKTRTFPQVFFSERSHLQLKKFWSICTSNQLILNVGSGSNRNKHCSLLRQHAKLHLGGRYNRCRFKWYHQNSVCKLDFFQNIFLLPLQLFLFALFSTSHTMPSPPPQKP